MVEKAGNLIACALQHILPFSVSVVTAPQSVFSLRRQCPEVLFIEHNVVTTIEHY